ncbi:MAG: ADP-ribosylglycohydrolase family protein [Nitriliruptoraceae bacterium]
MSTTHQPERDDRLVAAFVGTALGDALGAPFEGQRNVRVHEIIQTIGNPDPLRWTDDTHMAIALAESLLACNGTVEAQHLGDTFAAAYHDQPWRGYAAGPPTVFALAADGMPYLEAARSLFGGGSYGNGGAMRAAPAAILAYPDLARATGLAAAQARVTHAHPIGIDGAVLFAGAIVQAASAPSTSTGSAGETRLDLTPILGYLTTAEMRERLQRMIGVHDDPHRLTELAGRFGSRVSARESVPAAVAVFLANRDDPIAAITAAISLGRDTDTVAAMAGALAGAHQGMAGFPEHLLARLEDRDRIEHLAWQLARMP